jgi:quinohemoprotein ethanol dehydrogenase
VWDAIAYDPELGMIYFGTGNGVAWNRDIRSPGGGDNLYLSSIIALDAGTGEQKWYYQTTPGDNWDFDSASHLILADLKIHGKDRKVVMQAPKNGYFYVLDRKTGELLSATKFADNVTWAKGVDLKTGRPIEVEGQRYEKEMAVVAPSAFGAHNWQPMSFSPKTGLVYIPAQEVPGAYERDPKFKIEEGGVNTGIRWERFRDLNRTLVTGQLLAWDPVRQKEAWRVPYRVGWNGGTLATAGNLVFQGTSDGRFVAYSAREGKKLWEIVTGTGVIAGPMSYEIDGVQYVSVSAGWGGTFAQIGGDASTAGGTEPHGKVLTFALASRVGPPPPADPELAEGERLFHHYCTYCHGVRAISGTAVPDLRHSSEDVQKMFGQIVKNGIPATGMAGFGKWIGDAEIRKIQSYVRARAKEDVVRER